MSMSDLARKYHVTRQAVFKVIEKGLIPAHREGREWRVFEADYNEFRAAKYNRCRSKFNGDLLYRPDFQEMSPRQCAKLFGLHEQHVYYLVRHKKIPFEKRGAAVILRFEDCMKKFGPDERQQKFA